MHPSPNSCSKKGRGKAFLSTGLSSSEQSRVVSALHGFGVNRACIQNEDSIVGTENAIVVVGSRDLQGARRLAAHGHGLRVVGVSCLHYCLAHRLPLPTSNTPVLNNVLDGQVVCFSGVAKSERKRLSELVEAMGGETERDFTDSVTVLCTEDPTSAKGVTALRRYFDGEQDVSVVRPAWLLSCWEDMQLYEPWLHRVQVLDGVRLSCTGLTLDERELLRRAATLMGAVLKNELDISCSHLVAKRLDGAKCDFARKKKVCLVTESWIWDCLKAGTRLDTANYTPSHSNTLSASVCSAAVLSRSMSCSAVSSSICGSASVDAEAVVGASTVETDGSCLIGAGAEVVPDSRGPWNSEEVKLACTGPASGPHVDKQQCGPQANSEQSVLSEAEAVSRRRCGGLDAADLGPQTASCRGVGKGDGLFAGYTFSVVRSGMARWAAVEDAIRREQGAVAGERGGGGRAAVDFEVRHVRERTRHHGEGGRASDGRLLGRTVVSDYWVLKCAAFRRMYPVKLHPIYQPLRQPSSSVQNDGQWAAVEVGGGGGGGGDVRACVTGVHGRKKAVVQWLSEEGRVAVTDVLSRKTTTHLVTIDDGSRSEKVARATEWGIPVVEMLWLEDTVAQRLLAAMAAERAGGEEPAKIPDQRLSGAVRGTGEVEERADEGGKAGLTQHSPARGYREESAGGTDQGGAGGSAADVDLVSGDGEEQRAACGKVPLEDSKEQGERAAGSAVLDGMDSVLPAGSGSAGGVVEAHTDTALLPPKDDSSTEQAGGPAHSELDELQRAFLEDLGGTVSRELESDEREQPAEVAQGEEEEGEECESAAASEQAAQLQQALRRTEKRPAELPAVTASRRQQKRAGLATNPRSASRRGGLDRKAAGGGLVVGSRRERSAIPGGNEAQGKRVASCGPWGSQCSQEAEDARWEEEEEGASQVVVSFEEAEDAACKEEQLRRARARWQAQERGPDVGLRGLCGAEGLDAACSASERPGKAVIGGGGSDWEGARTRRAPLVELTVNGASKRQRRVRDL